MTRKDIPLCLGQPDDCTTFPVVEGQYFTYILKTAAENTVLFVGAHPNAQRCYHS